MGNKVKKYPPVLGKMEARKGLRGFMRYVAFLQAHISRLRGVEKELSCSVKTLVHPSGASLVLKAFNKLVKGFSESVCSLHMI